MADIIKSEAADDFEKHYIMTVDMSSVDGRIAVVNAYNNSEALNDHMGEVLHVVDMFATPGKRASRVAGQPDTECQNTYIITAEGKSYYSQSEGVARSANLIAHLFPDMGRSMQEGYIKVVCNESVMSNGNTIKNLAIVR